MGLDEIRHQILYENKREWSIGEYGADADVSSRTQLFRCASWKRLARYREIRMPLASAVSLQRSGIGLFVV